jgi:SH3-like domain-containing protein
MREEPSIEAGVLTQLRTGTIVHLEQTDGDWLRITMRGWVHKSTVTALEGE